MSDLAAIPAGAGGVKLTPMMQQYLSVKSRYPDAVLLYRLGDFYEMFFEDAERASLLLDLTLTSRNKGEEGGVPLCGVPHHSVQPYIQKLLENGLKVAICDQVEDPSAARGIVERKVVRVISPGTVLDEESLRPEEPSYLAAVAGDGSAAGLAVVDLSTGELRAAELPAGIALVEEIRRLRPREIVFRPGSIAAESIPPALRKTPLADDRFDAARFERWLEERFPAERERWKDAPLASSALAALLATLDDQLARIDHLRAPSRWTAEDSLRIDESTRRNLELVETARGERRGSLLWAIDRTATPMGARALRRWILYPLVDPAAIGVRLDAVEELFESTSLRDALGAGLSGLGDVERLVGRVGSAAASPRDLVRLRAALERSREVRAALESARAACLLEAAGDLVPLRGLERAIEATLVDSPPATAKLGDLIRPGCSPEVDELRVIRHDGKGWISALEGRERERTGISSLKIRYNRVFGYYIEVTKPNLRLVPAEYHRKQTIAGGERFVTPELKDYESKVLGAEERLRRLEGELFDELVAAAAAELRPLLSIVAALARIDAVRSLAEVAAERRWVRPAIDRSVAIEIEDGRHPVVERTLPAGQFVPNDLRLDGERAQIVILTGPNMAGKSTWLRQNALLVLLAQIGAFVPASRARIGIVDRIFTRVGAADDLAAGDSTFMVEMKETSSILANLTPRSLVVLDEIGRGTSTFDGISIAWAVAEYLHACPARPKTLFATHFHELTELSESAERVVNLSVAVKEWRGDIVFLRRIVPGPASQSYGIHVARLAGVPDSVVARAREILERLEEGERADGRLAGGKSTQLGLFGKPPAAVSASTVVERLLGIDPMTLTPIEALGKLAELVELAKKEGGR